MNNDNINKKAIIFICQRVPYPPNRGDRITTWSFIKHLSKRYNVHLFCMASDLGDLKKRDTLLKYCTEVNISLKSKWKSCLDAFIALLFSTKPLTVAYYFSKKMKKEIRELVGAENIELIYNFSSNMFVHVYDIENVKKVLHLADVDSEKFKKLAKDAPFFPKVFYNIEFSRLRDWELKSEKIAEVSVLCTEEEKKLFHSVGAENRVEVVKNGVDTEYFKSSPVQKEDAIVFTGVMNYLPNIDAVLYFYEEVLPLIKKQAPEVKVYVVGMNPVKEIQGLSKKDSNCVVTGFVDDVRPFLQKAKVFIAPMRIAQGIQNKILEALSMEVPVVTNSQMAKATGLSGESQGLLVADSPEEICQNILRLLNSNELVDQIGKAGRKAVVDNYSWDKQLQELDKVIDSIL